MIGGFSGQRWPEWIETSILDAISAVFEFSGQRWPEWIETVPVAIPARCISFSGQRWPEWIETLEQEKRRPQGSRNNNMYEAA